MSDEKHIILDVDGDLDMSEDGSTCRIQVTSPEGTPLTAQIILDAVTDMLMHYYSLDESYWKRDDNEDLDS